MSSSSDRPVAVVTGGAGGLGSAVVERLLADGLRVAIADVSPRSAVTDTLAVTVDVSSWESARRMAEVVIATWGRIDVLVNTAGVAGVSARIDDYPIDVWRQVVETNLTGGFHCSRAVIPTMLDRGWGRIVNIASVAGTEGNPDMCAYSASKAGVVALTRGVGKELARTGVLVNCVVPAVFDAGLTEKATPEERELFKARVPMGRMGTPDEFAELVAWLSSERCSFCTGSAFHITGGR